MTNITQGQKFSGDPEGRSSTSRWGPRRSIVISSIGSLVLGIVLSTAALPAMANVVTPSARFAAGTTTMVATTTTTTTTTIVPPAKLSTQLHTRHERVVKSSFTPNSRSNTNGSASPTTTAPTPTTVVTPTTVAPITTTTVKSPPATKAPALTISNPSSNIAPSPDFLVAGACSVVNGVWSCANPCVVGTTALSWPGYTNGVDCTNYILGAINNARSVEGVRPMVLPSNWFVLTTSEQLFVVADLERTARGLPPYVGINAALSADAQHAAATNRDPSIATGFPMADDAQGSAGFGGAWSSGFNVLAADYIWMYDDSWGGSAAKTSNIVCTSAGAPGCWAHRDELLGSDPGYNPGVGLGCTNCEVGTGFAMVNGDSSFVDLIEIPKGSLPSMTFTWANDVLPNLP